MLKKIIPKSEFSKNIFALSIGSIAAQAINFFLTIYLTKIYSPSDFGLLTIYISVSSLIGVFAAGKYDVAIVVAKTRKEGISLVRLCFFITLIFSFLILLIFLLFKPIIESHVEHPEIINWFYFLPLTLFFTSISQIFWMWNVREKKFKDLSVLRMLEIISNGGFSIILKSFGAIGLMFGTLISQFVSSIYLGLRVIFRDKFNPFRFAKVELQVNASKYAEFPKFNILQGFADMFLITGIVIIGSSYFSIYIIGLYSLCMRVLQLPMGLIVRPIAHVFFAEASEIHRRGDEFFHLTKQTILRTALFASVIPISLFVAGPFLFAFVFGESWRESGVYAQILSVWIFLDLVKAPIAQIPAIVGKQKLVLYWTLLISSLLLLVIAASGHFFHNHPRKAFAVIAGYQCLQTVFFIYLFLNLSRKKMPL